MLDRLLRDDEAALMLGVATPTVRRMRSAGVLPEVRPTGARAVRVRESDVRALIARGAQPVTTPESAA
jgi:excisionase family DNA binding protein